MYSIRHDSFLLIFCGDSKFIFEWDDNLDDKEFTYVGIL